MNIYLIGEFEIEGGVHAIYYGEISPVLVCANDVAEAQQLAKNIPAMEWLSSRNVPQSPSEGWFNKIQHLGTCEGDARVIYAAQGAS